MNILQEIEGILNASNSTNGSDSSKEKEDFNLIDFGDESIPKSVPRRNAVDPFECVDNSDLLSDVIKELDKSTSISSRQNWTKFD